MKKIDRLLAIEPLEDFDGELDLDASKEFNYRYEVEFEPQLEELKKDRQGMVDRLKEHGEKIQEKISLDEADRNDQMEKKYAEMISEQEAEKLRVQMEQERK